MRASHGHSDRQLELELLELSLALLSHLFSLSARRLLLIEFVLENIAICLQFNDSILVLAIQLVQFALQLVLLLFEKLHIVECCCCCYVIGQVIGQQVSPGASQVSLVSGGWCQCVSSCRVVCITQKLCSWYTRS